MKSGKKAEKPKKNGFDDGPLFDRNQWGSGFPGWGASALPGPGLLFGKEARKGREETREERQEEPQRPPMDEALMERCLW